MRVFVIAITLFLLNLSVVLVDTLDIYNFNIATDEQWIQEVKNVKGSEYDPDLGADVATSFGFGDFISGLKIAVNMIWRVVNVGATLRLFGVDAVIANTFGFGAIILYGIGLGQIISNRATKGMQ